MNNEDALNENLEYCNQLSERINIVTEAVLRLDEKVNTIEIYLNELIYLARCQGAKFDHLFLEVEE